MTSEKQSPFECGLTRRQALQVAGGAAATALLVGRAPELWAEWPAAEAATVEALAERLPRTAAVIAEAAAQKKPGQLYVVHDGRVIADLAWGKGPHGETMGPGSLVSWASAVKPTSCTVALQLWEGGKLDLDDPVTKFIPEFAVHDKGGVRIRHLMTHTGHLGGYRGPTRLGPTFAEDVNSIIRAPRRMSRAVQALLGEGADLPPPGTNPGYDPAGIWVLAEVCRRLENRPFDQLVRERVFEPCGMLDSWCGMPLARYRSYKAANRFASTYMDSETEVVKCQPAGGGIGPTRELGRFYEMMLARGSWNGNRIVSPQTVEAATTPKTGTCVMGMWGLGFNLGLPDGCSLPEMDSERLARLSQRYGPHASPRSFGHGGASGMQAFADPEAALVVTHIGRLPIGGTIYEDLGLARG
jgi:CubicO group peptidase (beta-lactamase class C family)